MNTRYSIRFNALPEETRDEIIDAIRSLLKSRRSNLYVADILSKPQSFGTKLTRAELLELTNVVLDEENKKVRRANAAAKSELRSALLSSPTFVSLMKSSGAKLSI